MKLNAQLVSMKFSIELCPSFWVWVDFQVSTLGLEAFDYQTLASVFLLSSLLLNHQFNPTLS